MISVNVENRHDCACFVVSLKRAVERRARITAALNELDIPFSFVDAIDGADGLSERDNAMVDRESGMQLSDREYACALSHAKVYAHILQQPYKHALILEDDAIPLAPLSTFIEQRIYQRQPMYLLYHGRAYVKKNSAVTLWQGVESLPLNMSCSYAVAYTVSRNAARQLLQASRPVRYIADWPMDLALLDAHITRPVLVQHPPDQSISDIARDRKRKRKPRWRYLTSAYYRKRWIKHHSERVEPEPFDAQRMP